MIRFKLILLSVLLSGLGNINLFTQHVSKIQELPENAFLYALPKTSLLVEIHYIRKTCYKGQFGDYTKEFMGYKPEINENTVKYSLLNVKVESFSHPDHEQFYVLAPVKGEIKYDVINNLSEKGLIFTTFNEMNILLSSSVLNSTYPELKNYIPYESIYKDRIDTTYKKEYRDSAWVNVPYYERTYQLKEEKDHAREAANLLIWLNDNIIKAAGRLNPEDEYDPDVSVALFNETNKLISRYQRLFNGICYSDTLVFRTVVTPERGKDTYNIASFSDDTGINNKSNNKILLIIESQAQLDSIVEFSKKLEKQSDRLFYRIPANTMITVNFKEQQLYQGWITVQQLGNITSLPLKMVVIK